MNINVSMPKTQALKAQNKPTLTRPYSESWSVAGETFESTADLVGKLSSGENIPATFTYRTAETSNPYSKTERIKNAVGQGLIGATAGAAVGGLVGAGLAYLTTIGQMLGSVMGGPMEGVSQAAVLVPLALGAAAGAAIGGGQGYSAEPAQGGGSVTGLLTKNEQGTMFYPGGQVDQKVSLEEFQQAPVPQPAPARTPASRPAANALKGAALAGATIPAQLVPLGFLATPALGYKAGAALDSRTSLGRGLGLAAGTAVGVATIAALNSAINGGNAVPLMLAAGGLVLGGAALGDKVFTQPASTSPTRDYGNQWWNTGRDTSPQEP